MNEDRKVYIIGEILICGICKGTYVNNADNDHLVCDDCINEHFNEDNEVNEHE